MNSKASYSLLQNTSVIMARRCFIPGYIIFAICVLSFLFSSHLHSTLQSSIYSKKVSISAQGKDFGPKFFEQRYCAFQFHFHPLLCSGGLSSCQCGSPGGGGGGGTLIFSAYVGSDPAFALHPQKISGISSTPKKYLKFYKPQKISPILYLDLKKRP